MVFSLLWLFKVSAFLKLAGGQKDTFASIWNCLWQNYEKYEWDYWWAAKYFKIAKIIGIFSFYYIFAIFCKFWIVNEIVNYIDKLAIFSTITFHESLTLVENLKRVNVWGKFVSFLRKIPKRMSCVLLKSPRRFEICTSRIFSWSYVHLYSIIKSQDNWFGRLIRIYLCTISRSSKIYLFSFENIQNS